MELNGSIYGIGSGDENATLYKAMYERDFAGRRFAAGMLDSWNLQSLGPVTTINSSKIYGLSYGNRANSTVFDNSQSLTPIVVFSLGRRGASVARRAAAQRTKLHDGQS